MESKQRKMRLVMRMMTVRQNVVSLQEEEVVTKVNKEVVVEEEVEEEVESYKKQEVDGAMTESAKRHLDANQMTLGICHGQ